MFALQLFDCVLHLALRFFGIQLNMQLKMEGKLH